MHLLKSDPETYSLADLERDGQTSWDGVRNATALRNLRNIQTGDELLIYHSGGERAVVGLARATIGSRPDPTDPAGKAVCVDIQFTGRLARPIALAEFKGRFPGFDLVRISRLSVMAVPADVEAWLRPQLATS